MLRKEWSLVDSSCIDSLPVFQSPAVSACSVNALVVEFTLVLGFIRICDDGLLFAFNICINMHSLLKAKKQHYLLTTSARGIVFPFTFVFLWVLLSDNSTNSSVCFCLPFAVESEGNCALQVVYNKAKVIFLNDCVELRLEERVKPPGNEGWGFELVRLMD